MTETVLDKSKPTNWKKSRRTKRRNPLETLEGEARAAS